MLSSPEITHRPADTAICNQGLPRSRDSHTALALIIEAELAIRTQDLAFKHPAIRVNISNSKEPALMKIRAPQPQRKSQNCGEHDRLVVPLRRAAGPENETVAY